MLSPVSRLASVLYNGPQRSLSRPHTQPVVTRHVPGRRRPCRPRGPADGGFRVTHRTTVQIAGSSRAPGCAGVWCTVSALSLPIPHPLHTLLGLPRLGDRLSL